MTGPDRSAWRTAFAIQESFDGFQLSFREITARARGRFEVRDWHGMQHDAAERLDLYGRCVADLVDRVRELLGDAVNDHGTWRSTRLLFTRMIAGRHDVELAETYFNSATRRIFSTVGVNHDIEFVDSDFESAPPGPGAPVFRSYPADRDLAATVQAVLLDAPVAIGPDRLGRDAAATAATVAALLGDRPGSDPLVAIDVARSVFYRSTGAYLVGRLRRASGVTPLVLALRHLDGGIGVDAVLTAENEVSIVFSFTRSYFHVDLDCPAEMVGFLKSIMPKKPVAELYISIGYNKHGKTELYRDLLRHLRASVDRFEPAPGDKGLVMEVFTLPSWDEVFKIIRDTPGYPKRTTHQEVMDKYRLVFRHDKVGRLVDAQEFEHLRFPRARFAPELLDLLLREAPSTVSMDGDSVVFAHLFFERRVTPLNLFLRRAEPPAARAAVLDWGWAIKDLAAANIFPGDLLLKNFGVTRHGRVVFYDYDEVCLLTDCVFRRMPPATNPDDELDDQPWFSVGDADVFPEEFVHFLGLEGGLRELVCTVHADLFDASFWRALQDRLRAGEVIDPPPYRRDRNPV